MPFSSNKSGLAIKELKSAVLKSLLCVELKMLVLGNQAQRMTELMVGEARRVSTDGIDTTVQTTPGKRISTHP